MDGLIRYTRSYTHFLLGRKLQSQRDPMVTETDSGPNQEVLGQRKSQSELTKKLVDHFWVIQG